MEQNKQTDIGAMIGGIIIVVMLVIGAFYFAGQRIEKSNQFKANMNQLENSTTSSDEVSDLENNANSMNFDNLGSDIDNL